MGLWQTLRPRIFSFWVRQNLGISLCAWLYPRAQHIDFGLYSERVAIATRTYTLYKYASQTSILQEQKFLGVVILPIDYCSFSGSHKDEGKFIFSLSAPRNIWKMIIIHKNSVKNHNPFHPFIYKSRAELYFLLE